MATTKTAGTTTRIGKPIAANKFHDFVFDKNTLPTWKAELSALDKLISPKAAPGGVGEKALLAWFGESVDRIALLIYALYRIAPTQVARELTVGDFRSDFAWIDNDKNVNPTVGLIELESCEPSTLFIQKGRKAPYLGSRFLAGFGQLVDWCAFGQAQASTDATISAVLGARHQDASYEFALVAGDQRFAHDALSQRRMQWWNANVKLGAATVTRTFDYVVKEGAQALDILDKVR